MFDQKAIARMAHIDIISAMDVCFILYTLYYVKYYKIVTSVTGNYSDSAFLPFQQGEIVSKTLQLSIGPSRNLKIVLYTRTILSYKPLRYTFFAVRQLVT